MRRRKCGWPIRMASRWVSLGAGALLPGTLVSELGVSRERLTVWLGGGGTTKLPRSVPS